VGGPTEPHEFLRPPHEDRLDLIVLGKKETGEMLRVFAYGTYQIGFIVVHVRLRAL
jgi:hypothetical protein